MTFVEKLQNAPNRIKQIVCTRKFWVELVVMTVGMFVAAMGVYFFWVSRKTQLHPSSHAHNFISL